MVFTFSHDPHTHAWHRHDDGDEPRWGGRRGRRRAEGGFDGPAKGRQARRSGLGRDHTFAKHLGPSGGAVGALVAALVEFGRAYRRQTRDGDA